jgi:hypothetical protein
MNSNSSSQQQPPVSSSSSADTPSLSFSQYPYRFGQLQLGNGEPSTDIIQENSSQSKVSASTSSSSSSSTSSSSPAPRATQAAGCLAAHKTAQQQSEPRFEFGMTGLMVACREKKLNEVIRLLEAGANVNAEDQVHLFVRELDHSKDQSVILIYAAET